MWVYVVSESLGIGCMAMFAAFPSTILESTRMGQAPEAPAPLLWRRPEAASMWWMLRFMVPYMVPYILPDMAP